ncbi:hypothetical protein [Mangrovihabitans endophyticus]|uniref:Uncharacterized protein n=1 Tax=Mangrovihabitans endophyticus TaxID=1751298 RepID=A0A8J3BY56_9ACTN|nr:hypothetical protein [Mangrovihabitans endophyticus]GGK83786.1 hypothetical protein GCM10012284_17380 [Mangrovihabitans endophyticus]
MTLQEPKNPLSADHDIPDSTQVIVVSAPSPVFVDSTGRRRRFLRRLSYAFGAIVMIYSGLVSVSVAGGPVSSKAVLPLPDLGSKRNEDVRPDPPPPGSTPGPVATSPAGMVIAGGLPRVAPSTRQVAETTVVSPRRRSTPPPSRTPTAKPSTTKPSTTTPSATPSAKTTTATPKPQPSTPPTVTPPPTAIPPPAPQPPAPQPPKPPVMDDSADAGGTGGGSAVDASAGGGTGTATGASSTRSPAATVDMTAATTKAPQPPAVEVTAATSQSTAGRSTGSQSTDAPSTGVVVAVSARADDGTAA